MDALERFLLVATGDEMVGSLNSHEAQVPPSPSNHPIFGFARKGSMAVSQGALHIQAHLTETAGKA